MSNEVWNKIFELIEKGEIPETVAFWLKGQLFVDVLGTILPHISILCVLYFFWTLFEKYGEPSIKE